MESEKINNHAAFIWSVADLLRGVYKQSEYGRVILPLTVLRRLDCVLEPTKEEVLAAVGRLPDTLQNRDPLLAKFAGQSFFNTSRHTFATLLGDPDNVAGNLRNYIAGFSESARDIVDKFNFDVQIDRLDDHGAALRVVDYKSGIDYGFGGKAGVYHGGRRFQHVIYTLAAAAVLNRAVSGMEYHFPTRRGENRVWAFEAEDLSSGGLLVATLLDGVAAGHFPATENAKDDCRYCDYGEICGVRSAGWGQVSCRVADWTARNLKHLPELESLRQVRNWG